MLLNKLKYTMKSDIINVLNPINQNTIIYAVQIAPFLLITLYLPFSIRYRIYRITTKTRYGIKIVCIPNESSSFLRLWPLYEL